jgi:hypothetical protein
MAHGHPSIDDEHVGAPHGGAEHRVELHDEILVCACAIDAEKRHMDIERLTIARKAYSFFAIIQSSIPKPRSKPDRYTPVELGVYSDHTLANVIHLAKERQDHRLRGTVQE